MGGRGHAGMQYRSVVCGAVLSATLVSPSRGTGFCAGVVSFALTLCAAAFVGSGWQSVPTSRLVATLAVAAPVAAPCEPDMAYIEPAHAPPFCIDVSSVSLADYRDCSTIGECKRAFRDVYWPQGELDTAAWRQQRRAHDHLCNEAYDDRGADPVNCVTWHQAAAYCAWRGGTLPTEAQWVAAARARGGRGGGMLEWTAERVGRDRVARAGLASSLRRPAETRDHRTGFRCAQRPVRSAVPGRYQP